MKLRTTLWTLGALAVILLAFGSGYVAWPLLHGTGALPARAEGTPESQATERGLSVFWEAWNLLDRSFYGEKPNAEERLSGAVSGMVASFGDPYTVYVEPQPRELERDRLRGSFGGIGAAVEFTATRYILRPLEGQPAEKAGVRAGDELRSVDALTITEQMNSDEVVSLIRGPVGTPVTLGLRRGPAARLQELEITVIRAEIRTPSLEYRLLDDDPRTADIGYLRHSVFSERSAAEMEEAITDLLEQGARRFILDLRGNPGGLVDAATGTADLWLEGGTILREDRADGTSRTFAADRGDVGEAYPLVVVVDGGSASASEIVAGALQDAGRARLVGERTFGKGSVQQIFELADESSLHVTSAQWFTPDGRQISGNGLAPEIAVEAGSDPLPAAIDAVLELPVESAP